MSNLRRSSRAGHALLALLVAFPLRAGATTFFVAPSGDDNVNTGEENSPFASMARAQAAANPGDTVLFRDGIYPFTSATAADGVDLTKSGLPGSRINYWAYPGEIPVFDFSGMSAAARIKGINVTASYVHLRGIEIKNVPQNLTTEHESWAVYNNGGAHNIYELLNLHHNMGPGLFIVRGGDNLVLNCDSHHNYDPKSSTGAGTNADGFGCHVNRAGDTGNVFRGCRAWWNSDDGYDLIQAQEAVTIENSWAWYNGYMPDSTTASSGGDGNGFKAGGYGVPATKVPPVPPTHVVRFSVSFRNRAAGFYQNHHPVSNRFENDTALDNRSSQFNLLGLTGTVGISTNNVALGGTLVANGPGLDDASNSWTLPVTVSADDFVSMDFAGVDGPRQADGSLPNLNFLKLRTDSDLIDKGKDLGFPFNGAAPDLGAFESGPPLGTGGSTANGGAGGNAGSAGGFGGAGLGGTPPNGGAGSSGSGGGGAMPSAGAGPGGAAGSSNGGAGGSSGSGSAGASGAGTVSGSDGGNGTGAISPNAGGPQSVSGGDAGNDSGCACRAVRERPETAVAWWLGVLFAILTSRRRVSRMTR